MRGMKERVEFGAHHEVSHPPGPAHHLGSRRGEELLHWGRIQAGGVPGSHGRHPTALRPFKQGEEGRRRKGLEGVTGSAEP